MTNKSLTEKKLLKHHAKFQALEAELQLIYPPKVFAAIETLARAFLEEANFDHRSREAVSRLAFLLRQETFARFGHESLETIILAKLLRQTHKGWKQPPPRLDSVSHMRTYHRNHRLDATQEAAAEMIKKVWEAFGKFRFIGARGMEGGGGGGQNLHPLDVMGDETWEHYQKFYVPWYKKAAVISVNRKRYQPGGLTLAAICFKILVEDHFPEEVDRGFGLVPGVAYRGLKAALSGYYEPELMQAIAEQGLSAADTRQDGKPIPEPAKPARTGNRTS